MEALFFLLISFITYSLKKDNVLHFLIIYQFLFVGLAGWNILPQYFYQGFDIAVFVLFLKYFDLHKLKNVPLFKIIFFLFLFSILTFFYHGSSFNAYFMGFRLLFIPFLLLYVIIKLELTNLDLNKVFRTLIIISFIQVFISFFQYIYKNGPGDWAGGSLGPGSTNELMLFQICIVIILLDNWLRKGGLNFKRILALLFLSMPIAFGSSKAGYILLPSVVIISIIAKQFSSTFTVRGVFYVTVFTIFSGFLFSKIVSQADIDILSDSEKFETYNSGIIDDGNSIARGDILYYTFSFLKTNSLLVQGAGLGNLYHSASVTGKFISPKNIYMSSRSGVTKVFGELGFIGVLIYCVLFANISKSSKVIDSVRNPIIGRFAFLLLFFVLILANSVYSGIYFKGAPNFILLLLIGYIFGLTIHKPKYSTLPI